MPLAIEVARTLAVAGILQASPQWVPAFAAVSASINIASGMQRWKRKPAASPTVRPTEAGSASDDEETRTSDEAAASSTAGSDVAHAE
jgi:hypothetical protein